MNPSSVAEARKDGSLDEAILERCAHAVAIPGHECSNLTGRSEAAVIGWLSESVIKAHAPRVKARRAVTQPCREPAIQATNPASVDRVPAWLGAASAALGTPTRFSTPVTARLTETSLG